jgi:uncharacterized protein YjiS (DUF1127 family)
MRSPPPAPPLHFRRFARKCLQRWRLLIAQAWRQSDERDALPAISDHLLRDIGVNRLEATFMEFGSLPAPPPDVEYVPRTSFCSVAEQPVHKLGTPPSVAPRNRPAPEARLTTDEDPGWAPRRA